MKTLSLLTLFCIFTANANPWDANQPVVLNGVENNKPFTFTLKQQTSSGKITGKWGTDNFELSASRAFKSLEGRLPSGPVNLKFSKAFNSIAGSVPCGRMDLSYPTRSKVIKGSICGQPVQEAVDCESDYYETCGIQLQSRMYDMAFEKALMGLPYGVMFDVRNFIENNLNNFGL